MRFREFRDLIPRAVRQVIPGASNPRVAADPVGAFVEWITVVWDEPGARLPIPLSEFAQAGLIGPGAARDILITELGPEPGRMPVTGHVQLSCQKIANILPGDFDEVVRYVRLEMENAGVFGDLTLAACPECDAGDRRLIVGDQVPEPMIACDGCGGMFVLSQEVRSPLRRERLMRFYSFAAVDHLIGRLEDGEHVEPSPFDDLLSALPRVGQAYVRAVADGAPGEVLSAMRSWIQMASQSLGFVEAIEPEPAADAVIWTCDRCGYSTPEGYCVCYAR